MRARVWYRIGRRGAVLTFLGLLDALFGYSFLVSPMLSSIKIDYLLPYAFWGWTWIAAAAVCFAFCAARIDRAAFALEAAVMSAWGLVSGYIWVTQHIPRLWVSAVIWLAFAGLILIISSWPESQEIHVVREALYRKGILWTRPLSPVC